MKAVHFVHAMVLMASLLAGCATAPAPTPADRQLSIPENATDRDYLGLPQGTAKFRLEEIRCEVLVIDCFDMYCHICQSGAKHVNELYRLVQEHGLGNQVKVIGLGLGDSPLEVATYKDKFKVPFPVFPDRRATVAKQFGPVRLPNLIVLRKQGDAFQVVNTSPGPLLNPSQVLSHIQKTLEQSQSYYWNDLRQAAQPTCDSNSELCRKPDNARARAVTAH
jgi:AhpC/TSA family protein